MLTRQEKLSARERAELRGLVSIGPAVTRLVLFTIAIGLSSLLAWRLQRLFGTDGLYWIAVPIVVAVGLYRRSARWTGGRALREAIRADLAGGTAVEHVVEVIDAVVFAEREDEGPVVFVRSIDEQTLVFVGQDLARSVAAGFPWRRFTIRETPHARRCFRLTADGPSVSPGILAPLSSRAVERLELGRVARWAEVGVSLEEVREIAASE